MAAVVPVFLLVLFLLSNTIVLPSLANENVVIANVGEDVLYVDRPFTLRCLSMSPGFMSLSWWKDRVKMAEVSGSGDITPNPAFANVTFSYNGNIFSMDFPSLSVGDGGVYSCTIATANGTESTETVQLEVYTKDQCVADSNGGEEYLVSDIPPLLLLQCTYPTLPSQALKFSWFDSSSSLDDILSFSPVSNEYITSVKALYSVDRERNGTILTCLVGEQAITLDPSTALFSCSLGPLYFYDHPFVEIVQEDAPTSDGDGSITGGSGGIDAVSFSCRLVPSSVDGSLSWTVPSRFANSTVEYMDGVSTISIDISDVQTDIEMDITCAAETQGGTYRAHRSFAGLAQPDLPTTDMDEMENNTSTELPIVLGANLDEEPDGLDMLRILVIALSVTVVVLVLVLLQITIWCLIRQYDRRRKSRNPDVKDVHVIARPDPTADTKSVSGFTNDGFSEPPQYNDIFMTRESRSMSIGDRRIEIRDEDEDDESSDEVTDDHVTRRFQRQSTVSTFSDTATYTPINQRFSQHSTSSMFAEGSSYIPVNRRGRLNSCPQTTARDDPLYDSAPESMPIYARANKHRVSAPGQARRNGSISSDRSRQRNISLDNESGISVSERPFEDEIYFELTEGEIESTAC